MRAYVQASSQPVAPTAASPPLRRDPAANGARGNRYLLSAAHAEADPRSFNDTRVFRVPDPFCVSSLGDAAAFDARTAPNCTDGISVTHRQTQRPSPTRSDPANPKGLGVRTRLCAKGQASTSRSGDIDMTTSVF